MPHPKSKKEQEDDNTAFELRVSNAVSFAAIFVQALLTRDAALKERH